MNNNDDEKTRETRELLDVRELVRKLDAGIGRITEALGFAPGGADFDAMVRKIRRMENVELTKGLLDALVVTPLVSSPLPEARETGGVEPEVTHLEFTVKGLPGFRATMQAEACRELQLVFEALLGRPSINSALVRTSAGVRRVVVLVEQLGEVLRLVEEAEAAMSAGLAGKPEAPSVLCARLREALGV